MEAVLVNVLMLSDEEKRDGKKIQESEHKWHPTKACIYCGEKMF